MPSISPKNRECTLIACNCEALKTEKASSARQKGSHKKTCLPFACAMAS